MSGWGALDPAYRPKTRHVMTAGSYYAANDNQRCEVVLSIDPDGKSYLNVVKGGIQGNGRPFPELAGRARERRKIEMPYDVVCALLRMVGGSVTVDEYDLKVSDDTLIEIATPTPNDNGSVRKIWTITLQEDS